jgi:3-hydroxyacyl-CoA dehydrogenase
MDANSEINRVAIVGTGLIGSQLGRLFSIIAHGLDVVATDPAPGTEARVRTANVVKSQKIELQNKRKQNEYLICTWQGSNLQPRVH